MIKKVVVLTSFLLLFILFSTITLAFEPSKLGIHILSLDEVDQAKKVVSLNDQNETWNYVTVPLTLQDLKNRKQWQKFFDEAKQLKIIPLVRLTTEFNQETGAWEIPTKKNIVDQIEFLSSLNWPTDKKHIIVYNEVNHIKEWGGKVDPHEYARVLLFTANWAHTEQANFVVLPAGLDLAAPNGNQTLEAFNYLDQMLTYDPEVFEVVDIWNSHSYPNPGFSSSPTRFSKNSLRGYQHELSFIKQKTGKDFQVMITETGWDEKPGLSKWLASYYAYAFQHVWSDDRILAVTPFVLKGSPGPFDGFSFLDENDEPTNQFYALRSGLEKVIEAENLQQASLE